MKRVTRLLALVTLVMGIGSTACTTADGMRQREQSIAAKDARLERDCVDRVMLFSRAANELAAGRGERPEDYYVPDLRQCLGRQVPKHRSFAYEEPPAEEAPSNYYRYPRNRPKYRRQYSDCCDNRSNYEDDRDPY